MIYAFDTYYREKAANTVCIGFSDWEDWDVSFSLSQITEISNDYVSGEFYKRELPCILEILKKIDLKQQDIIIIDGYVFLDDQLRYGLGGHLYHELGKSNPIIGVAKSNFATLSNMKRPILRGKSRKPLYVTTIGLDLDDAANKVTSMFGEYRVPNLLKKLDQLTRLQ